MEFAKLASVPPILHRRRTLGSLATSTCKCSAIWFLTYRYCPVYCFRFTTHYQQYSIMSYAQYTLTPGCGVGVPLAERCWRLRLVSEELVLALEYWISNYCLLPPPMLPSFIRNCLLVQVTGISFTLYAVRVLDQQVPLHQHCMSIASLYLYTSHRTLFPPGSNHLDLQDDWYTSFGCIGTWNRRSLRCVLSLSSGSVRYIEFGTKNVRRW